MLFTSSIVTAILAFGSSTSAMPAPAVSPRGSSAFTLIATASTTPVQNRAISASGNNFFIGKDTATFCPSVSGVSCSGLTTSSTVLQCADATGAATSCAMNVEVPGGQLVYVNATGELSYTSAHSSAIPSGAFGDSFKFSGSEASEGFGSLGFCEGQATAFFACAQPGQEQTGPWKILANLPGVDVSGCIGIDALATDTSDAAYQYE